VRIRFVTTHSLRRRSAGYATSDPLMLDAGIS
jgi:hypothetical protein